MAVIVLTAVIALGILYYLNQTGTVSLITIKPQPAQLEAEPSQIQQSLDQSEQAKSRLKLINNGTETVSFDIKRTEQEDAKEQEGGGPAWLLVYPSEGQIETGQTATIRLEFSAVDLKPQDYQAFLQINGLTVSVQLTVEGGPLIDLMSIKISDGSAADNWGNNDKVANPGERVALTARLENIGQAKAEGVRVKVRPADQTARVVGQDTLLIGKVDNRFSARFLLDITNQADSSIPPVVYLITRDSEGHQWLENFYLGKEGKFDYPTGLKRKK